MTASVLLAVLFPLIFFTGVVLWFYNKGSILFKQQRPGKDEKPFVLYKFQTMIPESSGKTEDERITALGHFLRKTSLDELPQLFNVIKGEMSLIGPRPLLMEYLPLYNNEQRKRHTVYPGITGWAQVMGRNSLEWEEKFKLDIEYTSKISFLFDLKILGLTFFKIFSSKGVYNKENKIMGKFKGNSPL